MVDHAADPSSSEQQNSVVDQLKIGSLGFNPGGDAAQQALHVFGIVAHGNACN